jgi:hypothetical protein
MSEVKGSSGSRTNPTPFYVNTALNRGVGRSALGGPNWENNCEFCAAAGAVNLAGSLDRFDTAMDGQLIGGATVLQRFTSSEAAGGQMRDTAQMDGKQVACVEQFVRAHSGRQCVSHGVRAGVQSYANATAFMLRQPDKTVFAIRASGLLVNGATAAHWLNAIKIGGEIRYFDFQVNTAHYGRIFSAKIGKDPASCNMPFVGIVTARAYRSGRALHSSDPALQVGMFETAAVKMTVLAFPPTKK